MSSIKNRRLLLTAVGVSMLLVSLFAAGPVFAQSGTSTPQATSSSSSSGSSGSTSATASPSAAATQAVPSTGGAAAQCFTYQDLVNEQLQPGSIYYVAQSGDTLAKIAQMFGVSESQLISANSFLTASMSSSSSGSSATTPSATSSSSGSSSGGASSSATPAATSSSSGSTAATPAATSSSSASVPSTGGFSLNSCVVSGVSSSGQPLDQGTFNGQNFVLMPGALLRIPVSPSALVPATGGSSQSSSATPSATSSSSSSGSTSATPSATSSSSSSGSTSATPSATQSSSSSSSNGSSSSGTSGVPNTGANFTVSPQEFANRLFMFGSSEGSVVDGFYVAKNGDSLSRLASRWGVSVSSILAVNPEIVNANMIYRGEALRVPAGASVNGNSQSSVSSSSSSSSSGDNDVNESPSVDNDVSR